MLTFSLSSCLLGYVYIIPNSFPRCELFLFTLSISLRIYTQYCIINMLLPASILTPISSIFLSQTTVVIISATCQLKKRIWSHQFASINLLRNCLRFYKSTTVDGLASKSCQSFLSADFHQYMGRAFMLVTTCSSLSVFFLNHESFVIFIAVN